MPSSRLTYNLPIIGMCPIIPLQEIKLDTFFCSGCSKKCITIEFPCQTLKKLFKITRIGLITLHRFQWLSKGFENMFLN